MVRTFQSSARPLTDLTWYSLIVASTIHDGPISICPPEEASQAAQDLGARAPILPMLADLPLPIIRGMNPLCGYRQAPLPTMPPGEMWSCFIKNLALPPACTNLARQSQEVKI